MSRPDELIENLRQAKVVFAKAEENYKRIELELKQADEQSNEARRAVHTAWKAIQDAVEPGKTV